MEHPTGVTESLGSVRDAQERGREDDHSNTGANTAADAAADADTQPIVAYSPGAAYLAPVLQTLFTQMLADDALRYDMKLDLDLDLRRGSLNGVHSSRPATTATTARSVAVMPVPPMGQGAGAPDAVARVRLVVTSALDGGCMDRWDWYCETESGRIRSLYVEEEEYLYYSVYCTSRNVPRREVKAP